MADERRGGWGLVLAIAVLALLVYGGAYLALVTIPEYAFLEIHLRPAAERSWVAEPVYRFGGRAAEVVFAPAHAIDRRLRPERWAVQPPF